MHWDDDLAGVARRIAETDASPLRVAAGPGTGKTLRLDGLIAAMEQVIAAWPAENTEDTYDGKVVGTVSPGQRARWDERFGVQLADVRRLWRQIDYQMTSGKEFAGTVVDASVLETAQRP